MPKLDYRNTEYCKKLKRINRKKNKLLKKIKIEHSGTKIIYNSIKNYYRAEFYSIYNNKCSYCGAPNYIVGIDRFEIDHYIHESSFNGDNIEAGKIENLVASCVGCNRKKGKYLIEDFSRFHPDMNTIEKFFYRNANFEIKIIPKYRGDQKVLEFYEKLKLGSDFRRLDYLLLRLYKMIKRTKDSLVKGELSLMYIEFLEERNNINTLKN